MIDLMEHSSSLGLGRRCSRCDTWKPFEEMSKDRTARFGMHCYCKPCMNADRRKYWHAVESKRPHDPEKRRAWHIMRTFGLTTERWNAIKDAQNNQCAICKSEEKLVPDHCHDTKVVRGALCLTCNSGIGMLKDSLKVVVAAAGYLADPPGLNVPGGGQ